MHSKHAQPSVYTAITRYSYIQRSPCTPGNYCMLLVSSCQGESSTSARLKCCQSFNSPGGLGLQRKRFSLLWKQKRQSRQYYAIGNSTIALFELCLSLELICCLAPRSAQQYLAFLTHFQTTGVNSFQAGLNLSVWLWVVCALWLWMLSDPCSQTLLCPTCSRTVALNRLITCTYQENSDCQCITRWFQMTLTTTWTILLLKIRLMSKYAWEFDPLWNYSNIKSNTVLHWGVVVTP